MNTQEYRQLQAERATLENLLNQLPASSVIERTSLEFRKKEVEEALASQQAPSRQPVQVRLTFRGKPIVGNHGIFADFGTAVVNAFTDAVAAIGASQYASLGSRGVLPNRADYQFLITSTALGSFGFELEEAPHDNMFFPELAPVESAIEQTKSILEATVGTDEILTDAISETDPRALEALRAFLKIMADQEAVFTLEFKDDVFRFSDVGQVRRSESRLSQDNIHEEEQEIVGHFQGVLPTRRTFEFLDDGTGEVISGKVSLAIEDAAVINNILNSPAKIKVHSKRVGTVRPRYVLLAYEETRDQGED